MTDYYCADDLIAEGTAPEEEILSVLHVPPGKMGCVIGKRGASILSVKESCKYVFHWSWWKVRFIVALVFSFVARLFTANAYCSAEILMGGAKGPPDKVSLLRFG